MANQQPDFSPEEMAQIQRHGKALLGEPTDFDEAVEEHLTHHYPHEAGYSKMHAAAQGGGDLGPSEMEKAQVQQQAAMQQQAATKGAVQAQQAQAAQVPNAPPPAPAGPVGTSIPYPAQRGSQGPPAEREEGEPEQ